DRKVVIGGREPQVPIGTENGVPIDAGAILIGEGDFDDLRFDQHLLVHRGAYVARIAFDRLLLPPGGKHRDNAGLGVKGIAAAAALIAAAETARGSGRGKSRRLSLIFIPQRVELLLTAADEGRGLSR